VTRPKICLQIFIYTAFTFLPSYLTFVTDCDCDRVIFSEGVNVQVTIIQPSLFFPRSLLLEASICSAYISLIPINLCRCAFFLFSFLTPGYVLCVHSPGVIQIKPFQCYHLTFKLLHNNIIFSFFNSFIPSLLTSLHLSVTNSLPL
jgi:hypothetical protein